MSSWIIEFRHKKHLEHCRYHKLVYRIRRRQGDASLSDHGLSCKTRVFSDSKVAQEITERLYDMQKAKDKGRMQGHLGSREFLLEFNIWLTLKDYSATRGYLGVPNAFNLVRHAFTIPS